MKNYALRKIISHMLAESFKVRGYVKPSNSFHTLADLQAMANYILNLQRAGYDARDKSSGLLLDPAPNSRATRSAKDLTMRPNASHSKSMEMGLQSLGWARAGQKWWTSFLCPLF